MNEKKILGRDGIIAAKPRKTITVDCRPDFDGDVILRNLTYGEMRECGGDINKQLVKMLVDESGKAILTEGDEAALLELPATLVYKLIEASNNLHRLTAESIEDTKKNSTAISSADSDTGPQ